MDAPRFFLPADQIAGVQVRVVGDDLNHLARVLRLGAGDWITVLDGLGGVLSVQLTEVTRHEARGQVARREEATGELPVALSLVQAVIKGERFEWLIQKATELGVARLVPILTERTVVRIDAERGRGKLERWQAIAKQAAEQSERGRQPEILAPLPLHDWLARRDAAPMLACLERHDAPLLAQALAALPVGGALSLVVGPEGGFAPAEKERLLAEGATAVSLGGRILRAETAGLAALAVASQWADRLAYSVGG